jgi:hypothetical protein
MEHRKYRRSSGSISHKISRIAEMGSELYAGNGVRKLSAKYYQPIIQIQDHINQCYDARQECENAKLDTEDERGVRKHRSRVHLAGSAGMYVIPTD